jgi:hypothetical protein
MTTTHTVDFFMLAARHGHAPCAPSRPTSALVHPVSLRRRAITSILVSAGWPGRSRRQQQHQSLSASSPQPEVSPSHEARSAPWQSNYCSDASGGLFIRPHRLAKKAIPALVGLIPSTPPLLRRQATASMAETWAGASRKGPWDRWLIGLPNQRRSPFAARSHLPGRGLGDGIEFAGSRNCRRSAPQRRPNAPVGGSGHGGRDRGDRGRCGGAVPG